MVEDSDEKRQMMLSTINVNLVEGRSVTLAFTNSFGAKELLNVFDIYSFHILSK